MADQNQQAQAGRTQQKKPQQDMNQLLKVRREKLSSLQTEGNDPFVITTYDQTHHATDIKEHFDEMEGQEVSIAGRMMSKRVMGKASFANVQDRYGNIQVYVARDSLGEEPYKAFKKMDIGDIVGVKGTVFRTKMGEISVHASEMTLLSKNLIPLPEKFHGCWSAMQAELRHARLRRISTRWTRMSSCASAWSFT